MDFHSLLRKAKEGLEDLLTDDEPHSHTHDSEECHEDATHTSHRYGSFAPQSSGHAKWYVDGASYFWAVSMALEGKPVRFWELQSRANPIQRRGSPSTSWTGG